MYCRWVEPHWERKLSAPYVHIVFGARQVGKTTLLKSLLPGDATVVDLARPRERLQYLSDPDLLVRLCQGLPERTRPHTVFVDEAQSVPAVFDAIQYLYDADKNRFRFVVCGSSARKLRRSGANLLPGRSFLHRLFPLTLAERPALQVLPEGFESILPFTLATTKASPAFPKADLLERLAWGELPGVVTAEVEHRSDLLATYAMVHLEEEMRREAMVRDWPAFVRFLRLAATESGQILNYSKISREAGITVPTVKSHYQLLEDMFLGFRVPGFSGSSRRTLLGTDRFFFFDLGIRHAAAGLESSPAAVSMQPGPLFEQWVGIELWKRLQYLGTGKLYYLRTKDGAEVDFILERDGALIPIEVKWTERPSLADARHLRTFMAEHPRVARRGFIVCRCHAPLALDERITAIPWWGL